MRSKYALGWPVVIILALMIVLAACDGDDEDDEDKTPEVSPAATAESPEPDEEPTEVAGQPVPDQPEGTLPPSLASAEALFEHAAELARADLAARLGISAIEIRVLPPDTLLSLPDQLLCPVVEQEDVELHIVYLQYERFIYPYQFYIPADGGDAVVEACDKTLVDQDVLYVPEPGIREEIVDLVKADLRAREVDPELGRYVMREMTWNDDALGCPVEPGEETTPALIAGYLITYTLDGITYEYHTDDTGERIELCEPPIGYAGIEAFIFTLQQNEALEVQRTDEVARYDGLDAEGVILLMTTSRRRVGVFDFETPNAVRVAAGQINDPGVSYIFVSGYVLIVQEENSAEVYSILQDYAEIARSPLLERQENPPDDWTGE